VIGRRSFFAALLIIFAFAPARAQETGAGGPYAGRPLIDVLQDLNRRGLRIVFSTSIVPPALRVGAEPSGPSPREMLDQVLKPHGLEARTGPQGTLIVTRAPRSRADGAAPAASLPASSGARGSVRGRVVDAASDEPLPGVLVVSQRPDRRATTDADGRFEIVGLEPGRQSLYVSVVGYVLGRPEVEIAPGGVADVLVPLAPGAGAYTEQLTVRGDLETTRSAIPSRFAIASAELQELRGVLTEDPFRAMQAMPGAATGDDFRAEFSVRGSEFRQMGLTLDGVPAPWLVHAVHAVEDTGTVGMINADTLDEVTLTSGASPQLFGNRTGAWVESVLREGSRDALRVSGTLSFTGVSGVVEGPLGRQRRGAWLLSARQSYIDWLIRQVDREEQTTFGYSDAQSKLVYDVTPRHQISLTVVAGRSKMEEREDVPGANGIAIGRSSTGLLLGGWRATLGSAFALTQRTAATGIDFRNTNDFGQEIASGREWNWLYRADAGYAARHWLALDAGAAFDLESANVVMQTYDGSSRPPVLRIRDTHDVQRWRQGGYVRARLDPSYSLAVDGGVRFDREAVTRETTSSPWLLARWTPHDRWSFSAGTGRAHQFPGLSQVIRSSDRIPLHAERARYVDVSAEYRPGNGIQIRASAYDRDESDVLRLDAPLPRLVGGVVTLPPASELWANAATVSSRGFEIGIRRSAPTGLVGWASYAYGRTRNADIATGETYWADFDQRHQLNLHVSSRLTTRMNASARLRIGSNMPLPGFLAEQDGHLVLAPTRNGLRLPTYARLDLRVNRTYDFTKRRLTLFAEVINVLNRENVGRTDGAIRRDGSVTGFVETLFPILPSVGVRIEF
jgi:hypothetical protein